MKKARLLISSVFVFISILLILKPFIAFSTISAQVAIQNTFKSSGVVKNGRNRSRPESAQAITHEAVEERKVKLVSLGVRTLRCLLRKTLQSASLLLSILSRFSERATFFELIPNNCWYKQVSMFLL